LDTVLANQREIALYAATGGLGVFPVIRGKGCCIDRLNPQHKSASSQYIGTMTDVETIPATFF
jgi:hypothetical protein